MSKVIDLWEWKRARLGGEGRKPPMHRRARPTNRRHRTNGGFVRIGEVSDALLRRLME